LEAGLSDYFLSYNVERIHSSLDYQTPMAVYLATVTTVAAQITDKFLEKFGNQTVRIVGMAIQRRASPEKGLTGRQSPLSKNSRLLV